MISTILPFHRVEGDIGIERAVRLVLSLVWGRPFSTYVRTKGEGVLEG